MTVNINVRFPNLAQAPRTEVVYTALPFAQGEWNGKNPLILINEQGQVVDSHIEPLGARWLDGSVRYGRMLSRITIGANETKTLKVIEGAQPSPEPFMFHDALVQSAGKIGLEVQIKKNGQWSSTVFLSGMTLLEDNRLRKVMMSRQRIGDFVVDLKFYVASKQQIVRFELAITGSNPLNTLHSYNFEEIRLVAKGDNYISIHGAARRGASVIVPFKEYSLMANDFFGDGQKQSWYGEMVPMLDLGDMEQVGNAIAATQYVMYGMSTDWGTKQSYSSLGAIQKPDSLLVQNYWTQLINEFRTYHGFVNSPGGVWDDYLLGVTQTPFQTGAQMDFGCLEGGAVLHMGAAELLDMIYFMATEETKRPGHYYEADTRPVASANHPNWVVWNGVTHWHTSVSTDRLGKTEPDFGGLRHGWHGKDWEHHSSNLLALASLMTGSYLLLDEVNTEIELYLSGHTLPATKPQWSTSWKFTPRAFGRTHHAMCNHYLLTGRQDLVFHMLARFDQSVVPQWDGATRSPVRNWEHIRDDRVLGSTVDAWVPWNDSLGFVGVVALWNVTRHPAIKDVMVGWGNTILNYGWRARYSASELVDLTIGAGVAWRSTGEPLTEAEYNTPSLYAPGGGLDMWGLPVLEVIRNNPDVFGRDNSSKAELYMTYMNVKHVVDPTTPFSEYGQWKAIRLM